MRVKSRIRRRWTRHARVRAPSEIGSTAVATLKDDAVDKAGSSLSGGNWGGEVGAALKAAEERWQYKARSLGQSCTETGGRLHQTSANCTATEIANAALHSRIAAQVQADFG